MGAKHEEKKGHIRMEHDCVCSEYPGSSGGGCGCGVYTDAQGGWCANENCRARLSEVVPCAG